MSSTRPCRHVPRPSVHRVEPSLSGARAHDLHELPEDVTAETVAAARRTGEAAVEELGPVLAPVPPSRRHRLRGEAVRLEQLEQRHGSGLRKGRDHATSMSRLEASSEATLASEPARRMRRPSHSLTHVADRPSRTSRHQSRRRGRPRAGSRAPDRRVPLAGSRPNGASTSWRAASPRLSCEPRRHESASRGSDQRPRCRRASRASDCSAWRRRRPAVSDGRQAVEP